MKTPEQIIVNLTDKTQWTLTRINSIPTMECSIKVPYKNTEYTIFSTSEQIHNCQIAYTGRSLIERGWEISVTLYHPHAAGRYRVLFTVQRPNGKKCSQYVLLVDYDGRCPLILTCEDLVTGKKVGRPQAVSITITMEALFNELFCKPRRNGLTILPNPRMI